MNKLNYLLLGAAGLVLASCSNEEVVAPGANDGMATVTFNLSTPNIGTRTYSDGTTAQQLQYAVYYKDANGTLNILDAHTHSVATSNAEDILLQKQVTFNLVTGRTYGFVFWASEANAPYDVTFLPNGAFMNVNYETQLKANDETLDAFYVYDEIVLKGDMEKTFELKRPFAQINVGTNDYDHAEKSGYTKGQSHINVSDVYQTLNLVTGAVDNKQNKVEFTYNDIPENEKFPVDGHEYLTMAYVLVPSDKQTVNVIFDATDDEGREIAAKHEVGSVPVQRNYRTNIYGQLFTSNVDVNVIIEPIYQTPDYPQDALGLLKLQAQMGGLITLTENLVIDETITFPNGGTLDLNGFTVTGEVDRIFKVTGGHLTIKGNGKVEMGSQAPADANTLLWVDNVNATVTIEDGEFISNDNQAICVGNYGGVITIKGGEFKYAKGSGKNLLNCNNAAYQNKKANIVVKGGTFFNFNPEDNPEGDDTSFVADNYKVVSKQIGNDVVYTVVPKTTTEVASDAELMAALQNASNKEVIIIMTSDDVTVPVNMPENIAFTIMGFGAENSSVYMDMRHSIANGSSLTLKDLKITSHPNNTNHTNIGFDGLKNLNLENVEVHGEFHVMPGIETAIFNNCVFNFDEASQSVNLLWIEGGNKINVKNCTFDNSKYGAGVLVVYNKWQLGDKAVSAIGDMNFENCTFKGGSKTTRAAVQIHSELLYKAGTLTMTNCKLLDDSFGNGFWREVFNADGREITKGTETKFFRVIVDGVVEQEGGQTRDQEFE